MMMLDSGTVSFRASSRSTGNFPTPHSFASAARSPALPRSTRFGVNAMSFSYSAISAFQQYDASGWKCRVSDMGSSILIAICNWLHHEETGAILQAVFMGRAHRPFRRPNNDRCAPLRLPDQSLAGSARRQMEPVDHPRHGVRQPPAFSRAADEV